MELNTSAIPIEWKKKTSYPVKKIEENESLCRL